jgi:phosphoserine phosphatase RsbU/P
MRPELSIQIPGGETKMVPLQGDRLTLGRSRTSELCFADDTGLSRHHLTFENDADGWFIVDLGSKNGTLLNDQPLRTKTRLRPGDRIAAGHLVIVFGATNGGPENVVVFDHSAAEAASASTVVTSLEGALADQTILQPAGGNGAAQIKALVRAGRELADNRPLPELFPLILDLAIEAVGAQRGVLITLEGDRLAVRAHKGGESFRISAGVRDRVLREKTSVLVRDAQLDPDWGKRHSIVQSRVRTLMAAPLQAKDRIIGLIYVDSPFYIREFTKDDLSLLTVMANVAAVRIEHARLAEVEQAERMMARELERAASIQNSFLPERAPSVPGLELGGYNAPCRTVGGDYYDFLAFPNGGVALALGDVSGKGMPASLMMMALQARVQVMAPESADLASMMTRLNEITTANCPPGCFITFFFCTLDPATGKLLYCNAGHNPPIVIRADSRAEYLSVGGPVLGVLAGARYEEVPVTLERGDLLVIYSDGVTEATNPQDEEFGEERLADLLRQHSTEPASAVIQAVTEAVAAWTQGAPPADDVTLVVARRV